MGKCLKQWDAQETGKQVCKVLIPSNRLEIPLPAPSFMPCFSLGWQVGSINDRVGENISDRLKGINSQQTRFPLNAIFVLVKCTSTVDPTYINLCLNHRLR